VLGRDLDFELLRQAGGQEMVKILAANAGSCSGKSCAKDRGYTSSTTESRDRYARLSPAQRRLWHHQAAVVLAGRCPVPVEDLARHFYLAEDWDQALASIQRQSGHRRFYANQSAIEAYDRAGSRGHLAPDQTQTLAWQALQGRALVKDLLGRWTAPWRITRHSQCQARAAGDLQWTAAALRGAAGLWPYQLERLDEGLALLEQAQQLSAELATGKA